MKPLLNSFDVETIRKDFPMLSQLVYGNPFIFFDNAASTQKPQCVIDGLTQFYKSYYANIHRGVYKMSAEATKAYEGARQKVKNFINAQNVNEIIFLRGTTEAINLVSSTYGNQQIQEGDEIILSEAEHHSNIVPWQILTQQKKAKMKIAPINDRGEILVEEYKKLFTPKTKLVALAHISNALGSINPIKEMIAISHSHQIPVLIDGAQATPHIKINVQELDADFYAFSGHKMYGPTGIGVLYAKKEHLDAMPPYHGGGDMILSVTFKKSTYKETPYKFEAGTPDIAGAIGLGCAIDYLERIELNKIKNYETELLNYATTQFSDISGLRFIGTASQKAGVLSFVLDHVHPHDLGTFLDRKGIAIRTGHHCAQPVMQHFGIPATARASFSFYNTKEEIDQLVKAIHEAKEFFN